MSYSKQFRTVEEALEYFYILSDDEEQIDISQLPPEESGCLTDEEDIHEDTFQSILQADVCGKIEISTNIDNDQIFPEDTFYPEEPYLVDITKFLEKIYTGARKKIYQS
ncbi:uncharacterized protein TNCV_4242911 [Trichonephila clavipes]|nr:uncharacterized protein TNCV_4242911 [Trichonephila clavipes]